MTVPGFDLQSPSCPRVGTRVKAAPRRLVPGFPGFFQILCTRTHKRPLAHSTHAHIKASLSQPGELGDQPTSTAFNPGTDPGTNPGNPGTGGIKWA